MDWWQQNPDYSFRLYQTKAGFRLLFTNKLFDPVGSEVESIFVGLGADRLYRLLTRKQECFRARLTPKPWRMNMDKYPPHEPGAHLVHSRRHLDWIRDYQNRSEGYQVCKFIDAFGSNIMSNPKIARIVELHDNYTLSEASLPLA